MGTAKIGGGGKGDDLYLMLHRLHQNDSALMGAVVWAVLILPSLWEQTYN